MTLDKAAERGGLAGFAVLAPAAERAAKVEEVKALRGEK